MSKSLRVPVVLTIFGLLLATMGCNKLAARQELNRGVQAFKNGNFEQAEGHFQNAVARDPRYLNARLYLAIATMNQYVPDLDTPENNAKAQEAISEFQRVLQQDPKSGLALQYTGLLYFNMKKFEEAKELQRKVMQVDPNNPDPYYWIGVIDWSEAYKPRMEERAKIGLKPEELLKDKKVCAKVREMNQAKVEEGLNALKKALELRPDYGEAMAYLNLMYREDADISCDDPQRRADDLHKADEMVQKALATRQAKEKKKEASASGGITLNPSQ